jgi:hypothetical protein
MFHYLCRCLLNLSCFSCLCRFWDQSNKKIWWRNNYLTKLINICHKKQSCLRHGKHHILSGIIYCLFTPTSSPWFWHPDCLANSWINVPICCLLCFKNLLETLIWFTYLRICVILDTSFLLYVNHAILIFLCITAVYETVRCHGIIQVNLFMSTLLSKWNWMSYYSDGVVQFG